MSLSSLSLLMPALSLRRDDSSTSSWRWTMIFVEFIIWFMMKPIGGWTLV